MRQLLVKRFAATSEAVYEKAHGKFLSLGRRGVPLLVQLLSDQDPLIRRRASDTLAWLEHHAIDAVPSLVRLLTDPDDAVAAKAAYALGRIRGDVSVVLPALVEMVHCSVATRQAAALHALGNLGHEARIALPLIIGFLKSQHQSARWSAAFALGEICEDPNRIAKLLCRLLDDSDPEIVLLALNSLKNCEDIARCNVQLLGKLTQFENSQVRIAALEILGKIGSDARELLPTITKALESAEDPLRTWLAGAYWRIGGAAGKAVSVLIVELRGPNGGTACDIIGEMGPIAKDAIPELISIIQDVDRDADVSWAAIDALGSIGSDAAIAVPSLIRALARESCILPDAAISALSRIGRASIPKLIEALSDPNDQVRECSADAVSRFGQAAIAAVPSLEPLLRSESISVKTWACIALMRIDPRKELLPELKNICKSREIDEAVRAEAKLLCSKIKKV